jgi:hypothetical protein
MRKTQKNKKKELKIRQNIKQTTSIDIEKFKLENIFVS